MVLNIPQSLYQIQQSLQEITALLSGQNIRQRPKNTRQRLCRMFALGKEHTAEIPLAKPFCWMFFSRNSAKSLPSVLYFYCLCQQKQRLTGRRPKQKWHVSLWFAVCIFATHGEPPHVCWVYFPNTRQTPNLCHVPHKNTWQTPKSLPCAKGKTHGKAFAGHDNLVKPNARCNTRQRPLFFFCCLMKYSCIQTHNIYIFFACTSLQHTVYSNPQQK